MEPLSELRGRFPIAGRLAWIGTRPARDRAMVVVEAARVDAGGGLAGDRYAGRDGKRGLTLIQGEHLPVIAALLRLDQLDPARLRRNLVVTGINLLALRDRRFRIGDVLVEGSGPCAPCSRMETLLGPGAYNALRGHGGITARVVAGGRIHLGDAVEACA